MAFQTVPTAGQQSSGAIHTSSTDAFPPRTIVGVIHDVASGQGLAGAQILIAGTDSGALTDSLGRFRVTAPSTGPHSLVVQLIGYNEFGARIRLPTDRALAVQIGIEPTEVPLCGLIVCAGPFGCYAVEAIVRDLVTGVAPRGHVTLTVIGQSARDSMSAQAAPDAESLHLGAGAGLGDRGPYVVRISATDYMPWQRSDVHRDQCRRVVGNAIRAWLVPMR